MSPYAPRKHIQRHTWFSNASSSRPDPTTSLGGRAGAHGECHASSCAFTLPAELQPRAAPTRMHTPHPHAHPTPAQRGLASSQVKQHPWSVILHLSTDYPWQQGTAPWVPQPHGRPGSHPLHGSTDRQTSSHVLSLFPSYHPQRGCPAPSPPSLVAAQHLLVAVDQWPRGHLAGLGSPQAAGWLRGAGASHTPSCSS